MSGVEPVIVFLASRKPALQSPDFDWMLLFYQMCWQSNIALTRFSMPARQWKQCVAGECSKMNCAKATKSITCRTCAKQSLRMFQEGQSMRHEQWILSRPNHFRTFVASEIRLARRLWPGNNGVQDGDSLHCLSFVSIHVPEATADKSYNAFHEKIPNLKWFGHSRCFPQFRPKRYRLIWRKGLRFTALAASQESVAEKIKWIHDGPSSFLVLF